MAGRRTVAVPVLIARGAGIWLADIAANFVVILVIVIAVAAPQLAQNTVLQEQVLTPRREVSIAPPQAVELLRQRLLDPATLRAIDVDQDGAHPFGEPPAEIAFLLSQSSLPQLDLPETVLLFNVPRALRHDGRWSPEFLALAKVAADPDQFRGALQALLLAPSVPAAGDPVPTRSLITRLTIWGDWMLFSALLLGIWWICRLPRRLG